MIKKTFLAIYFTLFSSVIIEAKNLPENQVVNVRSTMDYKIAFNTFKLKNYKKSFKLFEILSDKYPLNEYIDFYYGRSAFELKKYELAFSAFDRVLILNEQNHRARLEYARTLYLMKGYKESKAEFQKVLMTPIPTQVRKTVEKFIKMIDDKQSGYVLNKVAIFGFGWSDNVENTANEYLALSQLQSKDKKDDFSFKAIVVANLIVPFKYNKESLTSESTAVLFLQEQDTVKSSNIFVTSLSTGIGYIKDGYKSLTS